MQLNWHANKEVAMSDKGSRKSAVIVAKLPKR